MSRRSRLRTFAARASLTLLVTLTFVWAASAWIVVHFPINPTTELDIALGRVLLIQGEPDGLPLRSKLAVERLKYGTLYFKFQSYPSPLGWITSVPLWPFAAPLGLATALLWRSELAARRRNHPSRCPRCGYDNAATPAGAPCPECGTPTSSTTAAPIDAAPPTA